MKENGSIFANGKIPGQNSSTEQVQHWINTSDADVMRQLPRRLPFAKHEEAFHFMKEMLYNNV